MGDEVGSNYYYSVKIKDECLPVESLEHTFHQSLKGGGGGSKAKRKDSPLPQTSSGAENGLILSLGTERNLPITRQEIQGREKLTARKGF